MKALLLYADRDFGAGPAASGDHTDLWTDLGVGAVVRASADGDEYLHDVMRTVLQAGLASAEQIRYRQDVLADCLSRPAPVRSIYRLATAAIQAERQISRGIHPGSGEILRRSLQVMDLFVRSLRQLRALADEHAGQLTSAGFSRLLSMLRTELDDAYLTEITSHLHELRFRHGLRTGAGLGPTGKGGDYVLRHPVRGRGGILGWVSPGNQPRGYELIVPDRDITGQQSLTSLQDCATGPVARALAQACENIRGFVDSLRFETGFYVGCLNLHEQLMARGRPLCVPAPLPAGQHALSTRGLRDAALLLTSTSAVVGNDVAADGRSLIIITGANQGGKSTFLRSIGLAQLMMQAGLFVAAESFVSTVCPGLYTHFRRPEDATMTSGKLDEELRRMSTITDAITPGSMLLCNESFSATNEREGSQLARDVIRALIDSGIRVLFVTHFYALAHGFYADMRDDALYLRADRRTDGSRPFRLIEGPPLLTSHAADIYDQVFGHSETGSEAQDGWSFSARS